MAILGLIAFVLGPIFAAMVLSGERWAGGGARRALLGAFLLHGAFVVFTAELLSAFDAITAGWVAAAWLAFCGLFAAIALWRLLCRPPGLSNLRGAIVRQWGRSRGVTEIVFWICVGAVFAFLTIVSLHAAPNNFDSLTYRLPRVMHWAQNQSIEFFPTQILRQNHRAPFAEWLLLHVFVLVRHDLWFSLTQLVALGGSCVGIYELAARWGGSARARRVAVALALTTPMALLQATNTQSDLVASLFLISFLVFGLRMTDRSGDLRDAVFCGAALGLGVLTRTPMILYCGVFGVWFAWRGLKVSCPRALVRGAAAVLVGLLVIAGHSVRNVQAFGSPISPAGSEAPRLSATGTRPSDVIAERCSLMNPVYFASNVIRNSAMHLQTPILNLNKSLEQAVWDIHRVMGITPEEPPITWPGTRFEPSYLRHEDIAGNPVQALLFVGSFGLFFVRRRCTPREVWWVGSLLVVGYLAISFFLKWQPWHSRVQLPLFLAACSFIAVVMDFRDNRPSLVLITVSAMFALPFLIDNTKRPLFGTKSIFHLSRTSQYFDGDFDASEEYLRAARYIKATGANPVGIQNDVNSVQYPLWSILREKTKRRIRFVEVNVTNASAALRRSECPDLVVATYPEPADALRVEDDEYRLVWRGKRIVIYGKSR